ncbi:Beta-glucosidase cel3A [Neonectria ditissima]|uniref:Beta-glucosidase cel3A n=1 Tax=Neonectria ditissima TaxID=78410 RepID=A0A0P7C2D2_9HYPO|nr:Beta-glucosidase cel3A [Neonectria ditissima]
MKSPGILLLLLAFPAIGGASELASSPEVLPSPQGSGKGIWKSAYAKAQKLVGEFTLEEKVNVTRGFTADNVCAGNTGTVLRLGWPGMCLHDAGNGVRATDLVNSYPSALHVGASWDKNLTYQRGLYMAKEFKAKGVNVLLGPNAGPLGRTPLGGRNWEGFSVDPYLSGQLCAETIIGHQDAGVIANVKHFIGNEQETFRRPYFGVEAASSNIDDKTLHEFYLWPFVDSVKAGVASVMCSYNRINNTYGCENSKLMNGVLKSELSFDGFVLLDWNAHHTLESANAGLDLVMPQGGSFGENLTQAVGNGTVSEARVTDMATRIIAAWYLTGQDADFPSPGIGMQNLTLPHKQVEGRIPESRPVILEGAIAGHVLVKNENNALPFRKNPKMLSVFGYDATVPATKNTDKLFELGYTSSPAMGQAVLGTEEHFDQAAKGGTIVSGGRAAANSPPYMSDPLSAIQHRAAKDGSWVNWDLSSFDPGVNAASDVCLVFINAIATEGWDRDGLHDDFSDGLVLNVASKCANTIVVIHAAGIRLVDQWIEHPNVTATIIAHLPGQDSGRALVKLLYGEASFSGKLPYTLAKNETDYVPYAPCGRAQGDTDPQCDFTEGVYVDYRAFDERDITPRYEFGFGLSYTTFEYSALAVKVERASSNDLWQTLATVKAKVRNTGVVLGEEVAQLYVGIPNSPPKQLRGFEKVALDEGEAAEIQFELTRRDLSVWDVVQQQWVLQSGNYTIFVESQPIIVTFATIKMPGWTSFLNGLLTLCITLLVAAELPANATELDLVFPRSDGRYAETDQGIPVLLSLQHPQLAYHYGWGFRWTISLDKSLHLAASGTLGAVIHNDTEYSANSTHLEVAFTDHLAPGAYTFEWLFGMGPWCEYLPGSAAYDYNPGLSEGSFGFAIEEGAPTPTFTGTCPTPVGAISFTGLTTWHGLYASLDSPTATTMFCAMTAPVTHEPEPCLATVDAVQERSISSRLQWGSFAPAATANASSESKAVRLQVPGMAVFWLAGIAGMLASLFMS